VNGVLADHKATRRTEWRLRNRRLTVWGLAFLHWLLNVLSIDAISLLGARIALGVGPRTKRHARAVVNIARAFPELSPEGQGRIARGMWVNFGRTVAESFVIDRIAADPSRVVCEGADTVRNALTRDGGAVFVGLHFGNWEATVISAARFGEHPIGLYKPLKNAHADAYLLKLRGGLYPSGLLPATPASVLRVARHLREGGSVCMLADHRDLDGLVVEFFGQPAPTLTLPARLSVKFNVPIFAARVDRRDGARFSVHIEEVPSTRSGDRDSDIAAATAAIQALFERWVQARPDQWV
jgi:Kdo2-lipid IVA lauroyltransferase/acyltransferase